MSHTADKIRRARSAVDDVMLELFSPQIIEGARHPLEQRADAGLHMCLAVASAALEVSRALLDSIGNGTDEGGRTLQSCARDASLVVDAALRARAILSERLPAPAAPG